MQAKTDIALGDNSSKTIPAQVRVLLVDDDQTMHEMLELCLTGTEYALFSATSVAEAMEALATDHPDIVITDAMMPGQSGFTLIATIKGNPDTRGIPIILWTVLEQLDGGVMDSSGKADITISKPFDLLSIMDSLSKAKQLIQTGVEITF